MPPRRYKLKPDWTIPVRQNNGSDGSTSNPMSFDTHRSELTDLNKFYVEEKPLFGDRVGVGKLFVNYPENITKKIVDKTLRSEKHLPFEISYDPHNPQGAADLRLGILRASVKRGYKKNLKEMVTEISRRFPSIPQLNIYRFVESSILDNPARTARLRKNVELFSALHVDNDSHIGHRQIALKQPQLRIDLDKWRKKYGRK